MKPHYNTRGATGSQQRSRATDFACASRSPATEPAVFGRTFKVLRSLTKEDRPGRLSAGGDRPFFEAFFYKAQGVNSSKRLPDCGGAVLPTREDEHRTGRGAYRLACTGLDGRDGAQFAERCLFAVYSSVLRGS